MTKGLFPIALSALFLIAGIVFEASDTGIPKTMFGLATWFSGLATGLRWDITRDAMNRMLDTPVIKEEKGEQ